MTANPPPGWYAVPGMAESEAWWDGTEWDRSSVRQMSATDIALEGVLEEAEEEANPEPVEYESVEVHVVTQAVAQPVEDESVAQHALPVEVAVPTTVLNDDEVMMVMRVLQGIEHQVRELMDWLADAMARAHEVQGGQQAPGR